MLKQDEIWNSCKVQLKGHDKADQHKNKVAMVTVRTKNGKCPIKESRK